MQLISDTINDNFNTSTFFVTTGRGTESFAEHEIKEKLNCSTMHKRDGKIFFTVPHSQLQSKNVFKLKSVERIFVEITDYKNVDFIKDKRSFLNQFMCELSACQNFFNAQRLIEEMKMSFNSSHSTSGSKGCNSNNCLNLCYSNKKNSLSEHVLTSQIMSNECADSSEIAISGDASTSKTSNSGQASSSDIETTSSPGKDTSRHQPSSEIPIGTCSLSSNIPNASLPYSSPPLKRRKLSGCEDSPSDSKVETLHHFKQKLAVHECECINVHENIFVGRSRSTNVDAQTEENICSFQNFRISVKCSGKVKRWLELKRLSRDVAWRISKATGWKVDLRQPDFEICIHISDEYVTAGIPLTKFPLSKRSYILYPGLRSTIAWIMSHLAKIKPGEIILDPMCGKATVLIEAFHEFEASLYLGSDCDSSQLTAAQQNLTKLRANQTSVSLVKADGLNLPYRDGCVDVVVCDVPFNQNHIIQQESIELFYNQFLQEINRVLTPHGRCVLLISQQLKETVFNKLISNGCNDSDQVHDNQEDFLIPFFCSACHAVQLGETQAFVIVLNK